MSENKEPDARNDNVRTPDQAAEGKDRQYVADGDATGVGGTGAPARGAGEYSEGDYGDAGTVDVGAPARGAGEYSEGDYGDAGAVDVRAPARGAGEYSEGDYGDAGTAGGSDVPEGRPNDLPVDQDAPRDRTEGDAHGRPSSD